MFCGINGSPRVFIGSCSCSRGLTPRAHFPQAIREPRFCSEVPLPVRAAMLSRPVDSRGDACAEPVALRHLAPVIVGDPHIAGGILVHQRLQGQVDADNLVGLCE
jgi:hypothetical protein